MLFLSRSDIEGLIDLPEAMRVTEDVLREQAAGRAVTQAPVHVHAPGAGTLVRIVSGALLDTRRMGLRASGSRGFTPVGHALALLFDSDTAELLSVMAYPFGTLRTAAVLGVATQHLAPADAGQLAMIGTGRNAFGLLRAAQLVRPVERIRVFGRNADKRAEFVAEVERTLALPAEGVASAAEATDGADVIYVSTGSFSPVLRGEEVPAGALVASMGTPGELDESVYLSADRVLVSAREHEERYRDVWQGFELSQDVDVIHSLLKLDAAGRLRWDSVGELSDVVAGTAAARADGETIVFRESQGGYGDIALASRAYEAARERGLGTECDLD